MSGIKGGKETGTESETAGNGTATTAMSIGRGAMGGNGTASGESTIRIVTDLGKSGLVLIRCAVAATFVTLLTLTLCTPPNSCFRVAKSKSGKNLDHLNLVRMS
jgi:hypothetical protein